MDFIETVYVDTSKAKMQQRIKNYFERQNYQARYRGSDMYYERGSVWHNYIAFNPASWHVFAHTELDTTDDERIAVKVWLRVDTQGQMVLDREFRYWQMTFDTLLAFLETGINDQEAKLHEVGQNNQRQNYALTIGIVVIIGIIGVVALLLILNSSSSCPCPP